MSDPYVDALREELPEGWTLYDPADPFAGFRCPHGYAIEPDGECPEGCVSPLKRGGLV